MFTLHGARREVILSPVSCYVVECRQCSAVEAAQPRWRALACQELCPAHDAPKNSDSHMFICFAPGTAGHEQQLAPIPSATDDVKYLIFYIN